jgi:alkylation response protein AidB-like acyl-CoA dehydrogenase
MTLAERFRNRLNDGSLELPLPGGGDTARRHRSLAEIAREDVSLARLAEAHCDAVAILTEAGAAVRPGVLYAVWASEGGDQPLELEPGAAHSTITGKKMFCTGAGIVDRALVTVGSDDGFLVDVDLREASETIAFDCSSWKSSAFAETNTATALFNRTPIPKADVVERRCWYLNRPGFWHGACGPASCWAGAAFRLVDYAIEHVRDEPHALAHTGALKASEWSLKACMEGAGNEIDRDPHDLVRANARALMFRHVVESTCSEILERFGRAFGPRPLAYDEKISRHHLELLLFLRQCHAERDLESLARMNGPTELRR